MMSTSRRSWSRIVPAGDLPPVSTDQDGLAAHRGSGGFQADEIDAAGEGLAEQLSTAWTQADERMLERHELHARRVAQLLESTAGELAERTKASRKTASEALAGAIEYGIREWRQSQNGGRNADVDPVSIVK